MPEYIGGTSVIHMAGMNGMRHTVIAVQVMLESKIATFPFWADSWVSGRRRSLHPSGPLLGLRALGMTTWYITMQHAVSAQWHCEVHIHIESFLQESLQRGIEVAL